MIIKCNKSGYPVKHKRKVPFNPAIQVPPEITEWSVEILRLDETSKSLLLQAKRAGSWFDLAQTRNWVDNVSDYRIRNRLNNLISRGALEEKGSTRSKKYRYSDPLNEILKRQM